MARHRRVWARMPRASKRGPADLPSPPGRCRGATSAPPMRSNSRSATRSGSGPRRRPGWARWTGAIANRRRRGSSRHVGKAALRIGRQPTWSGWPGPAGYRASLIRPRPVTTRLAPTTGSVHAAAGERQRRDLQTPTSGRDLARDLARASEPAMTPVSMRPKPPAAGRGLTRPGHGRSNRAVRSSDPGLPPPVRGRAVRPERQRLASACPARLVDRPIGKPPGRPGSGPEGSRRTPPSKLEWAGRIHRAF